MAVLAVVLLLACLERAVAQTFGCSNTKINDQARKMFYDAHNDARRSMAKGLEPNKCGLLSGGKNVYELNWDCEMEAKAQEWADGCPSSFQTFDPTWGQNYATYMGSIADPLPYASMAVNGWWSEIRTVGLTDPDNKYTNSAMFRFANMANGKASAFGCAYALCAGKLSINCIYNKIGYMTNAIIYEKGDACTSDAECTTYSDSQCKNGLCYKAPQAPVVETFTMCPSVTDQSDQARQNFLDTHNKLRTSLAKGLEADGIAAGAFAPMAKQMPKLKYSCTVEANARTWAKGCLYQHSTSAQRPGLGENLYMISINNMPKIQTAEDSSKAWWSELKDFGVGSDNILTQAVFDRGVGHYTQMAWEGTTEIGCFVENCPTFTYSVCQYGPAGNYMNQLIYTKGSPCTADADCPGTQTCSVAEALCVIP
ncbi:SCP domain-containing protein [Caenorhabditis elegans]|uniref:SCP domain-containing protein n=1 Tax=Caenorhabditis elegans TaxID=6239 RepID=Q8MQ79_CAEEL|nr:SCP domain-containing protein [Caenorhabditis elegans]CCD66912.1 SCP domain-containing protein [Caenorhabditis elegans]|eukprot:NP_001024553.1 Venom-Allergen-like Protein [Caenorhabditis elegans]